MQSPVHPHWSVLFGSNMSKEHKPTVLLIGGLDPQGCAGITADVQTVTIHNCHAVPLVTCITQQTSQGLTSTGELAADVFMKQYQACVADFRIDSIKIGLIPNIDIAHCISNIIDQHNIPVVLDPVVSSTSGGIVMGKNVQYFIVHDLFGKIDLLTPNLVELALFTQSKNIVIEQIERITSKLLSGGLVACLVKGGHIDLKWSVDYFTNFGNTFYCYQPKLAKNVRGTGCVLASSIASHLALGKDIRDGIVLAKAYVNQGIRESYDLGCYSVFKHSMTRIGLKDLPKLCYDPKLIGAKYKFPACPKRLGIYPIVDSSIWIKNLISKNVKTIQLRVKGVSDEIKRKEIRISVANCDKSIAFFVNDYWKLAIEENAYGVHLGQEDLYSANIAKIEQGGLRLGISTHSYWEISRALAIDPSYIAFGPVFKTTSKKMSFVPQGIEQVDIWTQLLGDKYSLVAIGGIDQQLVGTLKKTGIGSVAIMSAIIKADNYKRIIKDLISNW